MTCVIDTVHSLMAESKADVLRFVGLDPGALSLRMVPRELVDDGCSNRDGFDPTVLFGLQDPETGYSGVPFFADLGPVSVGTEKTASDELFQVEWGVTSRAHVMFDTEGGGMSRSACETIGECGSITLNFDSNLFGTLPIPLYLNHDAVLSDVMANWTQMLNGPRLVTSSATDTSNNFEHAISASGRGVSILQHYDLERDAQGLYEDTARCSCGQQIMRSKFHGPGAPCDRITNMTTLCSLGRVRELPTGMGEVLIPNVIDSRWGYQWFAVLLMDLYKLGIRTYGIAERESLNIADELATRAKGEQSFEDSPPLRSGAQELGTAVVVWLTNTVLLTSGGFLRISWTAESSVSQEGSGCVLKVSCSS